MEKIILGRDFSIEIHVIPLNYGFEPMDEGTVIRTATCVTNLDKIMTLGEEFLKKLPESDNHTNWY